MKKLLYILIGILIAVPTSAYALSVFSISQGGTNNGTAPSKNALIYFNGTRYTATSSAPLYVTTIVATGTSASIFPFASSTAITVTTLYATLASSTNFNIQAPNCNTSSALTTNAAGNIVCGAITASGGTYPFTPGTFGITNTSATSTAINDTVGFVSTGTSTLFNLSVINGTTTNATSTNLAVTGSSTIALLFGSGLATCNTGNALTWSGGLFGCAAASSFGFPFVPATNFNVAVNSTTTLPIWFQAGLMASSTSRLVNTDIYGNLAVTPTTTVRGAGLVIASTTALQAIYTDGNAGFGFRAVGGKLYIATTSPVDAGTTTASTVFTLTQSGGACIGIGCLATSTPDVLIIRDQDGTGPLLEMGGNPGGDTDWILRRYSNNNSTNDDPFVLLASGFETFRTTATGPSGFGTTSPWALLSVNPTFNNGTGPAFAVGSSTKTLFVINPNGTIGIASSTPSPLWAFTVATSTVFQQTQFGGSISSSTSAAAYTVNWETGNTQRFILNQNTTFIINATSSYPRDGFSYRLKICQDGTGSRTVTFATPGQLDWGFATTVISTGANTGNWIGMIYDARVQKYAILASSTNMTSNECLP